MSSEIISSLTLDLSATFSKTHNSQKDETRPVICKHCNGTGRMRPNILRSVHVQTEENQIARTSKAIDNKTQISADRCVINNNSAVNSEGYENFEMEDHSLNEEENSSQDQTYSEDSEQVQENVSFQEDSKQMNNISKSDKSISSMTLKNPDKEGDQQMTNVKTLNTSKKSAEKSISPLKLNNTDKEDQQRTNVKKLNRSKKSVVSEKVKKSRKDRQQMKNKALSDSSNRLLLLKAEELTKSWCCPVCKETLEPNPENKCRSNTGFLMKIQSHLSIHIYYDIESGKILLNESMTSEGQTVNNVIKPVNPDSADVSSLTKDIHGAIKPDEILEDIEQTDINIFKEEKPSVEQITDTNSLLISENSLQLQYVNAPISETIKKDLKPCDNLYLEEKCSLLCTPSSIDKLDLTNPYQNGPIDLKPEGTGMSNFLSTEKKSVAWSSNTERITDDNLNSEIASMSMHNNSLGTEYSQDQSSVLKLKDETSSQIEQECPQVFHNEFVSSEDFVYKCSICLVSFIRARDIRLHRHTKHKGLNTLYDGKTLVIRKEKKRRNKKPGYCDICGNFYSNIGNLRTHMMLHKNKAAFQCDICHKNLSSRRAMLYHRKSHFRDPSNKRRTLYETHEDVICEICGKVFPFQNVLKKHMKKHEGVSSDSESRFLCTKCPKTFDSIEGLNLHNSHCHQIRMKLNNEPGSDDLGSRYVHKSGFIYDEDVKRFRCAHCPRLFRVAYLLKEHMNIHLGIRPYKCQYCSKAFFDKDTKRNHEKTHEERKFTCDVCHMKFVRKANLRVHYRVHTGERPFECKVCGVRFRQQGDMMKHFKRHSEQERLAVANLNQNITLTAFS